jgi:hypothetical protein
MKTDLRELEEEFPNVEATAAQPGVSEEKAGEASVDSLKLRSPWNPQVSWWGTGWFEEWERAARRKQ